MMKNEKPPKYAKIGESVSNKPLYSFQLTHFMKKPKLNNPPSCWENPWILPTFHCPSLPDILSSQTKFNFQSLQTFPCFYPPFPSLL